MIDTQCINFIDLSCKRVLQCMLNSATIYYLMLSSCRSNLEGVSWKHRRHCFCCFTTGKSLSSVPWQSQCRIFSTEQRYFYSTDAKGFWHLCSILLNDDLHLYAAFWALISDLIQFTFLCFRLESPPKQLSDTCCTENGMPHQNFILFLHAFASDNMKIT